MYPGQRSGYTLGTSTKLKFPTAACAGAAWPLSARKRTDELMCAKWRAIYATSSLLHIQSNDRSIVSHTINSTLELE